MSARGRIERVVVLGSDGFLGRQLVAACGAAGVSVAGVDRTSIPGADALNSAIRRNLAGRPDIVFHAAGCVGDFTQEELNAAHVQSTEGLITTVAELAPGARVVVIGSAAEIGDPKAGSGRVPEREGGSPRGAYGWSKLEQSRVSRELGKRFDVDVIRVRVFNTLGRGQNAKLVAGAMVERLFDAIRAGGSEMEAFDPESVRDFLDVRDVARCLLALSARLPKDPDRPPVNVCSEEGLSVAGLVGELLATSGASVTVRWQAGVRPPTRVVGECPTLRGILEGVPVRQIETLTSLRDMWSARVASGSLA